MAEDKDVIRNLIDFVSKEDPANLPPILYALTLFVAVDTPGVYINDKNGFIWTKKGTSDSADEFDIYVGKITLNLSGFTVSVSVHWNDDSKIDSATVILNLMGNKPFKFVSAPIPYLKTAEPVLTGGRLTDIGPVSDCTFEQDLDFKGYYYEIKTAREGKLTSKFQALSGDPLPVQVPFTITLSPGKVFLFEFGSVQLGLYFQNMVIDLTKDDSSENGFALPGVYDYSDKGIYIKDLELFCKAGDWFGKIGGGNLLYTTKNNIYGLLSFSIEERTLDCPFESLYGDLFFIKKKIEPNIRIERSTLKIGIDIKNIAKMVFKEADSRGVSIEMIPGLPEDVKAKIERPGFDFNGALIFGIRCFDNKSDVTGWEFYLDSAKQGNSLVPASASGLELTGTYGDVSLAALTGMLVLWDLDNVLIWVLFGWALLRIGLTLGNANPELNSTVFSKIFLRFINWKDNQGVDKFTIQIRVSLKLRYKIPENLLQSLCDLLLPAAAAKIAGSALESVLLKGELAIGFDNIGFDREDALTDDAKEKLKKVTDENKLSYRFISIPEIWIKSDTDFFISVNKFGFINEGGKQGFTLCIDGGGYKASLTTVPLSLALYWTPEWSVDIFLSAVDTVPFVLLWPAGFLGADYGFLIKGFMSFGKPIPGIGGSQNVLSAQAGIQLKEGDKYEVANYSYNFAAVIAWGQVGLEHRTFDFFYFMISFESKTPICPVCGAVNLHGITILAGANVGPSYNGDPRDANAFVTWLVPNLSKPYFPKMKKWGDGDGWFAQNGKGGVGMALLLKTPNGSFEGELAVLFGPDFATIAGIGYFKSINAYAAIIIATDFSNFFSLKAKITMTWEDLFTATASLEFTTQNGSYWLYFGHYDEAKGGTVCISLFGGLLQVRGYFIFDTRGLPNFGIVCDSKQKKPDLVGPGFGLGYIWEFTPPPIGFDWLNIKFYAGTCLNVAYMPSPFLLYGDLYIGGYFRLKAAFFKFQFGLSAFINGMIDSVPNAEFSGYVSVNISMPWPCDDIDISVPIGYKKGDSPKPSVPELAYELSVRYLLERKMVKVLSPDPIPANEKQTIPIDAVLALKFNKSIGFIASDGGSKLTLVNVDNVKIPDRVTTRINGKDNSVTYTYNVSKLNVVSRHGVVAELRASWAVPDLIRQNVDDSNANPKHRTLYLGSWNFADELQVTQEQLDAYMEEINFDQKPPCLQETSVFVPDGVYPDIKINADNARYVYFDTVLGVITIMEKFNNGRISGQRLNWKQYPDIKVLTLPITTYFTFPKAKRAFIDLKVSSTSIKFTVEIKLGGDNTTYKKIVIGTGSFIVQNREAFADKFKFDIRYNSDVRVLTLRFQALGDKLLENITISGVDFYNIPNASIELLRFTIILDQIGVNWGDILPHDPDQNNLWKEFLFEPGTEYHIKFDVEWFAELSTGNNGNSGVFHPDIVFATEPKPSQDISNYVCPVTPALKGGDDLIYPDSAVVYFGYKYSGLIREIYRKHFLVNGLPIVDALELSIVDSDGNKKVVPYANITSRLIDGRPFDEYIEQIAQSCAQNLEKITYTTCVEWTENLEKNKKYTLMLAVNDLVNDAVLGSFDRIRYKYSFNTSKYQSFGEHIADLNNVIANPAALYTVPSDKGPCAILTELINAIQASTHPGNSRAIEDIYQQLLGIKNGWAGPKPGVVSFAGAVVNDVHQVLAFILEPSEPLTEKTGFNFENVRDDTSKNRGLIKISDFYVLLKDNSGGRMILLQTLNGAVVPIDVSINLGVFYNPAMSVIEQVRADIQMIPEEGELNFIKNI